MAVLDRTLPSTPGAVGFEIPIFRTRRGANSDLVQRIADNGTIERFSPCVLNLNNAMWVDDIELHAEEGEESIWTFRDADGNLIAGTKSSLSAYALQALSNGELDRYPMAAAEMAAFCDRQHQFPKVLHRAFGHLNSISRVTAASWRDVSVLLPAIRRDIAQFYRHTKGLAQIVAVADEHSIEIRGPKELVSQEIPLPTFQPLASIFGINSVRFISFETARPKQHTILWQLAGTGGMAAHTLAARPFNGAYRFSDQVARSEVVASGTSNRPAGSQPELLVRVLGSDHEDLQYASQQLDRAEHFRYRHAINIRPMGYGTPRAQKASVKKVFSALPGADVVWILASHRLRRTGSAMHGMAGMHTASRNLTLALQALVRSVDSRIDRVSLLETMGKGNSLGVVSTWRYNYDASLDDNLKRLIFNLLCEDVLLETAERIYVMWSIKRVGVPSPRLVEIGTRRYNVEFVSSQLSGMGASLVGFAIDVAPSEYTLREFRDFCLDLFSGYGWTSVAIAEQSMTVQKGDNIVRVFPVIDRKTLPAAMDARSNANERFLVLTNKTLPRSLKRNESSGFGGTFHYSELGQWLLSNFGDKLIGDR